MNVFKTRERGVRNFVQQKKSSKMNPRQTRLERQLEIPLPPVSTMPEKAKKSPQLTTFGIVMLLVFSAIVVVAYINNVITVDRLLLDIRKLEKQEMDLKQENERIRASMNMLSSYTRIQKIAFDQLGLVHSGQQPSSLYVKDLDGGKTPEVDR